MTSLLGPFVIVYILQQEEATCELYLEVWHCGVTREVEERRRVRLDTFPTIPTMCEEKKKKKKSQMYRSPSQLIGLDFRSHTVESRSSSLGNLSQIAEQHRAPRSFFTRKTGSWGASPSGSL